MKAAPDTEARIDPGTEVPESRWTLFGMQPTLIVAIVLAVAALLVLAVATIVIMQVWTRPQYDSHLLLANADRVHRLGGTYYTTTAEQKGPFWQLLYDVALRIGSWRDVWYVIATMIVAVGALTGAAVAGLLRAARIPLWAAIGAGIAMAIFMWYATEEWNRAFYSRNLVILMTTASLALVVAAARSRGWSRTIAIVLAGGIMGLAVQTNPGSTLTAGFVLFCLWVLGRTPGPSQLGLRGLVGVSITFAVPFAIVLAAAPVWYWWNGVLDDFWAQWWTYNMYYTESTGRSYPGILQQGAMDFIKYYADHQLYLFTVILFVAGWLLSLPWLSSWDRRLGLLLILWWFAEMVAVALSQRFFPHYLVLPFVPVAVMAAALFGKIAAWVEARGLLGRHRGEAKFAVVLVLVLLVVQMQGGRASNAIHHLLAFKGFERSYERHVARMDEKDTSLRNAVAAFSDAEDYVLAWTNVPWVWENMGRTAATRYVDKKWVTGEVFGGGTSSEWVLPDTWQNWAEDVIETSPELVLTFPDEPVPEGSPLANLMDCGYEQVYKDEWQTLYKANENITECLQQTLEDAASER